MGVAHNLSPTALREFPFGAVNRWPERKGRPKPPSYRSAGGRGMEVSFRRDGLAAITRPQACLTLYVAKQKARRSGWGPVRGGSTYLMPITQSSIPKSEGAAQTDSRRTVVTFLSGQTHFKGRLSRPFSFGAHVGSKEKVRRSGQTFSRAQPQLRFS
jgi:hypothetical protein